MQKIFSYIDERSIIKNNFLNYMAYARTERAAGARIGAEQRKGRGALAFFGELFASKEES